MHLNDNLDSFNVRILGKWFEDLFLSEYHFNPN